MRHFRVEPTATPPSRKDEKLTDAVLKREAELVNIPVADLKKRRCFLGAFGQNVKCTSPTTGVQAPETKRQQRTQRNQ